MEDPNFCKTSEEFTFSGVAPKTTSLKKPCKSNHHNRRLPIKPLVLIVIASQILAVEAAQTTYYTNSYNDCLAFAKSFFNTCSSATDPADSVEALETEDVKCF